jgi:hypothetical protein
MINKLLGISSIQTLQNKSNDILNVFTNTLKQLEDVNIQIESEITVKQDLINKTNTELNTLESIKNKNANMANKIGAFLI